MNRKTLIHTALFPEAKPIIEYFKLQCLQTKPYRIYQRDNIILIVSGMGHKQTLHVEDILKEYEICRAVSIGIAGCKDYATPIGTLTCTTHKLEHIPFMDITSVDTPVNDAKKLDTMLVDMEAKTFLHVAKRYLHVDYIYIFKIVSDHLDTTIPKKEFVWNIIEKNMNSIALALDLKR